jgi:hypothetical protein
MKKNNHPPIKNRGVSTTWLTGAFILDIRKAFSPVASRRWMAWMAELQIWTEPQKPTE